MKSFISMVLAVVFMIFLIPSTAFAFEISTAAKTINTLELSERQANKVSEGGFSALTESPPILRLTIMETDYLASDIDNNTYTFTLNLENAKWNKNSYQTFSDLVDIVFDSSEVAYTVTESNVTNYRATITVDLGKNHLLEDDVILINLDTKLTETKFGTEAKVSIDSDNLGVNVDELVFCKVSIPALTFGSLCHLLVQELGLTNIDTVEWENPFDYVKEDDHYYKDMLIAYYMDWIGRDTLSSDTISRQDLAEILYLAEQGGEPIATPPTDVSITNGRYDIICSVLGSGVMSLDKNGEFDRYADAYAMDINCDALKSFDIPESSLVLDLSKGSIEIKSTAAYVEYIQNDTTYRNTGNILVNQSHAKTKNTILINAEKQYAKPINLSVANLYIETDTYYPLCFGADNGYTSVNLTLVGENTITTTGYYNLYNDGTLTIGGNGTLRAINESNDAIYFDGITTINSGTIIANTEDYNSGIRGNNLTINNGVITATGEDNGICCDTLTINGGIITAIGGDYGMECDTLVINSGTVTATGKNRSGIGNTNSSISILGNAKVSVTGEAHAIGSSCWGGCDNEDGCTAITIADTADVTLHYNSDEYESGSPCHEIIYIDDQPLSSAALLGNSAAIFINAHGNSGLSYQWQSSTNGEIWTDVKGQTTATLTTPVTETTNNYYYRCKLTNGWGNVYYSDAAQAFVLNFAQQPRKQDTGLADLAALSVKASCEDVSYQWQSSADGVIWTDMTGGNASVITINLNSADESTLYRCILTATNGDQLISDTVTLENAKDITYTIKYYLEKADGSGYYEVAEQESIIAAEGDTVSIPEKTYEHFVENIGKGIFGGIVTADSSLELTRYYDRAEYEIIFDTNGGASVVPLRAKYGTAITLPTISKYGYVFSGWYLDEDMTEPSNYTKMPANGATLYAKWEIMGADRGLEYQFNGIRVTSGEGDYNDLDSIPAGTFYAEVSVTNKESKYMDTLMLASYDADGRMISLQYMSATSSIGQTVVFGSTIDNSAGNITTVKAFMVPLLNGLVPLAKTVTFGSN